jgi:hypothetical protein
MPNTGKPEINPAQGPTDCNLTPAAAHRTGRPTSGIDPLRQPGAAAGKVPADPGK